MTPLTHGVLLLIDGLMMRLRPTANLAVEWLRETAQPPPGLELRSTDGSLFTGVAAFERNKLVFMLAVRSGAPTRPPFEPAYRPAPAPAYQARLHDFDEAGDGWPEDPFLTRR